MCAKRIDISSVDMVLKSRNARNTFKRPKINKTCRTERSQNVPRTGARNVLKNVPQASVPSTSWVMVTVLECAMLSHRSRRQCRYANGTRSGVKTFRVTVCVIGTPVNFPTRKSTTFDLYCWERRFEHCALAHPQLIVSLTDSHIYIYIYIYIRGASPHVHKTWIDFIFNYIIMKCCCE